MIVWFILMYLIMNVNITSGDEQFNENENENEQYPKQIRHYNVRIDSYTNKPVERGRLDLLGGLLQHNQDDHKRVTLEEFKRILQCPMLEPELNRKGSIIAFIKWPHQLDRDWNLFVHFFKLNVALGVNADAK